MPGAFGIASCTLTVGNNRLAETAGQYFFLTRTAGPFCAKTFLDGRFVDQEYPYPGGNLFSLASGGAIFIRDPHSNVSRDQLNGGRLVDSTPKDWELILPYLEENEQLFGISIERNLLTVDGKILDPGQVYRKVEPTSLQELA